MSEPAPNRGEVWWMEHPEFGQHPACILTRQAAIPVLRTLLVAPATTQVRGIPTEVRLGPEDGVPWECVLTLDNVGPVRKALLTKRITRLGPVKLAELCAALNLAAGC
jgi:mRNA interferase MazF